MKVHATAKVHLTIEVSAGSWGSDCPLDQVYKQAREEALHQIANLRLNVVGEPRVVAVLVGDCE